MNNIDKLNNLTKDVINQYCELVNTDYRSQDIYEAIKKIATLDEEIAIFTNTGDNVLMERIKLGEIGPDSVAMIWSGLVGQNIDNPEIMNPQAFTIVTNMYQCIHALKNLIGSLPNMYTALRSITAYANEIENCKLKIENLFHSLDKETRKKHAELTEKVRHFTELGNIQMVKEASEELNSMIDASQELKNFEEEASKIQYEMLRFKEARRLLIDGLNDTSLFSISKLFFMMSDAFINIETQQKFDTSKASDRSKLIEFISGQILEFCGGIPENLLDLDSPKSQGLVDKFFYMNPTFYDQDRINKIRLQIMLLGRLVLDQISTLPDEIFDLFRESSNIDIRFQLMQNKMDYDRRLTALQKNYMSQLNFWKLTHKSLVGTLYKMITRNIDGENVMKISKDNILDILGVHTITNHDVDPEANNIFKTRNTMFSYIDCLHKFCVYHNGNSEEFFKDAAIVAEDFKKDFGFDIDQFYTDSHDLTFAERYFVSYKDQHSLQNLIEILHKQFLEFFSTKMFPQYNNLTLKLEMN